VDDDSSTTGDYSEVSMTSKNVKGKMTVKSGKMSRQARQTRTMRIVIVVISVVLILSWVLSLVAK